MHYKFWKFQQLNKWPTLHQNQCPRSVNATTILAKQSSFNMLGKIKIFSGWNTKSLWNAKSHFNICARIIQCSRISAPNTISHCLNSRKNNFWKFSLPIFVSKWQNFQHNFSSKCVFFNKNKPRIFQQNSTIDSRFSNNQLYRIQDFSTQWYPIFNNYKNKQLIIQNQ